MLSILFLDYNKMMYVLEVKRKFSAAHSLRGYGGECEKLHGHNFEVTLKVKVEKLNKIGITIDFKKIDEILKEILEELDHQNLNELPYFSDKNPSAENIAKFIFEKAKGKIKEGKVIEVKVSETDKYSVSYHEDL